MLRNQAVLVNVVKCCVFIAAVGMLCSVVKHSVIYLLSARKCVPILPYLKFKRHNTSYRFMHEPPLLYNKKVILDWTGFWSEELVDEWQSQCPDLPCFITSDRALYNEAAAVTFHMIDFCLSDLPINRRANQIFVFFFIEPPEYIAEFGAQIFMANFTDVPRHFFNWTMTYRTSADVWRPYGTFASIASDVAKHYNSSAILTKPKLAVWAASHCTTASKREVLVAELKRYMDVDTYGACGTLNCPKSQFEACRLHFERTYTFYFAFESSTCPEYATEKFWQTLRYNMIPVVLKRSQILSNSVPPQAFIAVDDFSSAAQLAAYLKALRNDKAKLLQHLTWKTEWLSKFHLNAKPHHIGFCQLCQKLWTRDETTPKSYENIASWYNETSCAA